MSNPEAPARRVHPVIITEPGAMTRRDISRLNKAGIIVVEAKNPAAIRFLDPPPTDRTQAERAAISLCRLLLKTGNSNTSYYRKEIGEMYAQILFDGIELDSKSVQSIPSVPAAKPAPK